MSINAHKRSHMTHVSIMNGIRWTMYDYERMSGVYVNAKWKNSSELCRLNESIRLDVDIEFCTPVSNACLSPKQRGFSLSH